MTADLTAPLSHAPTPVLPTVVVTSVIRSAHQGQSHGGAYLVDLNTGDITQTLDWNDGLIDWEGRGGDRGLRGIAFANGNTYLAASNEVYVFNEQFEKIDTFSNPYLKMCHEICVDQGKLYLTSTGFDSILVYDLAAQRFTDGYCLRFGRLAPILRRRGVEPKPSMKHFDPNGTNGPDAGDSTHLNSVTARDGIVHVAGGKMGYVIGIVDGRMLVYGQIPRITHNARPWRGGLIYNSTGEEAICIADREGNVEQQFKVVEYPADELVNADLPEDHARQAFGRGLTVWRGRYLIAGSSPATVTVYDIETGAVIKSINLTMDVRHAVHGLEVWPFTTEAEQVRPLAA